MLRIVDWVKHFETYESRKLKRLDWVRVPARFDGSGYTALVDHPDGAAHLGAWLAIVEVSAVQKIRGLLPSAVGPNPHDIPGICQSLARISRLRASAFEAAIPRFINEMRWIEEFDVPTVQESAEIELWQPTDPPPPRQPIDTPRRASKPSMRFLEFWAKYPRKVGQDAAGMDWISYVTFENEAAVFACLERFLLSRDVAQGAVPNAGSTPQKLGWIAMCAKDNWECQWPAAKVEESRWR